MKQIQRAQIRLLAITAFMVQTTLAKLMSEAQVTKTLVVLDNWATQETHSLFFRYIQDTLGHELEFVMANAGPSTAVKHYDQYYYENIIVMAPSIKENEIASGLNVDDLTEFFDKIGHNLMVFADLDARRHVRKLGLNFGIDFEAYHYYLADNSVSRELWSEQETGSSVVSSQNIFKPLYENANPIFAQLDDQSGGVLVKGIGSVLDKSNRMVFPILRAESTTFSITDLEPTEETLPVSNVSGEQLTLVAGYQSRSNNRATFSGSMAMCSDQYLLSEDSANRLFCEQLLDWNFQRSGVLKAEHLRHNKRGEACTETDLSKCGPNPENYKIQDNLEFFINVSQMTKGQWHAYSADDIQLQFRMLDPYYQVLLERVEQPGSPEYDQTATYKYGFRTPERLGIFKFKIQHWRYGYSFLEVEEEVAVIQWRHDGFPRYLTRAFPFYVTVFVLMAGFFMFIVSFLFSDFRKGSKSKSE